MELNEKRAVVVGVAQTKPSFQNLPTVITTYSRAIQLRPPTAAP